MSFYLEAPSGTISLQNLERFAEKRLDFLLKVHEAQSDRLRLFDVVQDAVNVIDSECLIDGSVKDIISHFILRLAFSKDIDTTEFFIKAETVLFEFRFLCMNEDEIKNMLRSTFNKINTVTMETGSRIFEILKIFCLIYEQTNSWRKVVKLYLKGDDSICFYLPFTMVYNLVAKRQVELFDGVAAVPFTKLREVMTAIFQETLTAGVQKAREQRQSKSADFRFRRIMAKLVKLLRHYHHPNHNSVHLSQSLLHDQVAMETKHFPPCMFNLQKQLERRHRLKHHSRIQLTLFLKEIGMPVHEALMFWRREYSIDVNNQDGCCHNWKDNEKRYIYNIRHLYGLEGAHINYRAHSCQSLQNQTTPFCDVGGCPFQTFDRTHLRRLLNDMGVPEDTQDTALTYVTKGGYSQACHCVMNQRLGMILNQRLPQSLSHDASSKDIHVHGSQVVACINGMKHSPQDCSDIENICECPDFQEDCKRNISEIGKLCTCTSDILSITHKHDSLGGCHGNSSSHSKSFNSFDSCGLCNKQKDTDVTINYENDDCTSYTETKREDDLYDRDSDCTGTHCSETPNDRDPDTALANKPSEYYFKLKKLLLN